MHGSIFCHYVYDKRKRQSKPSVIDSNRTQRARGLFSIQHYAGVVEGDSKSFLDKNKDELPKEAHGLFVAFVRCNICGTWKDTEWQERRGRNQRR
jgi:hypothetical protein